MSNRAQVIEALSELVRMIPPERLQNTRKEFQASLLVLSFLDSMEKGTKYYRVGTETPLTNIKDLVDAYFTDGSVLFETSQQDLVNTGIMDANGKYIMRRKPLDQDQIEWNKSEDQKILDKIVEEEHKRIDDIEHNADNIEVEPELEKEVAEHPYSRKIGQEVI